MRFDDNERSSMQEGHQYYRRLGSQRKTSMGRKISSRDRQRGFKRNRLEESEGPTVSKATGRERQGNRGKQEQNAITKRTEASLGEPALDELERRKTSGGAEMRAKRGGIRER